MAMFAGEPLPIEETPALQPSALGPSLLALGNIRYRIGHKSMIIYAFEDDSPTSDEPSQTEKRALDEEDRNSLGLLRNPRRGHGPPRNGVFQDKLGGSQAEAGPSAVTSGVAAPAASEPPLAYWLARERGAAPCNAVPVGEDLDGGPLFVGRACVFGEMLAGKVAPRHRVCYVASEGRELGFEKYEVLVLKRGRIEWVRGRYGSFPADAFPAGVTLQNQRVYVARARVNGILTPGRLVVGENECRISYNMAEIKLPEYDILTVRHLEPDENGMVRSISIENLDGSLKATRKRERPGTKIVPLCGTNSTDDEADNEENNDEGLEVDDVDIYEEVEIDEEIEMDDDEHV